MANRYTDSVKGALAYMQAEGYKPSSNVETIADSEISYIWLVIDHGRREAALVRLPGAGPANPGVEEIDYSDACRYSKR